MARAIKFRAWDSLDGKMLTKINNMHFGHNPNGSNVEQVFGYNPHTEAMSSAAWVALESLTVMQYTGLEDKNGKEIYEGDVIRAKHDDGHYDVGSVVFGRKGAFCIDLPKVATGIKSPLLNYIHGIMFDESDIEVIGNIYENHELLEGKE